MRKVIAFFVAPLAAMVPAIAAPTQWGFFAFLTLFYAYPLSLIVGVPIYLYFRRKNWLSLWQVAGAGALIGTAIPTLLMIAFVLEGGNEPQGNPNAASPILVLTLPLLGAGLGALVAWIFWLIAIAPTSSGTRTPASEA